MYICAKIDIRHLHNIGEWGGINRWCLKGTIKHYTLGREDMEMKRVALTTVVFLLAVAFVPGCTVVDAKEYFESSGDGYWEASYEYLDGFRQREVILSETGEHSFSIETHTNSGTFSLNIKDSDGKTIYTGNEHAPSSFQVRTEGEGTYTVRVDAIKHNGSFSIKWV